MKDWLKLAVDYTSSITNLLALVFVAVGTVETFLRGLRDIMRPSTAGYEMRDAYLRHARWLIAGLTFQLAADIVETAVDAGWDQIGRLAAIAVVRTFLSYFLERDMIEAKKFQQESSKAQPKS